LVSPKADFDFKVIGLTYEPRISKKYDNRFICGAEEVMILLKGYINYKLELNKPFYLLDT
jgi:hypothetical protein